MKLVAFLLLTGWTLIMTGLEVLAKPTHTGRIPNLDIFPSWYNSGLDLNIASGLGPSSYVEK